MFTFSRAEELSLSDSEEEWESLVEPIAKPNLEKINAEYIKEVKPIFKTKCLDCHGSGQVLPWYASLPGPKQLIDRDIKDAKNKMDMSIDFPFSGHGTPQDDFESLARTIKEDSMPPLLYRILHWRSSLTEDDIVIIKKWINHSLLTLNQPILEEK
ncbi:MAG: heme-binding domain-containing protein [Bdellovibrionaceae bacterium]|nr:heme-binding domain-containing protein [Pseudobdellovibrionaceae bacterium]